MEIWSGGRVDERGTVRREYNGGIVEGGSFVAWSGRSGEDEKEVSWGWSPWKEVGKVVKGLVLEEDVKE